MEVYVVLEDIGEAYVFNADRILIGVFLNEQDAIAKVDELSEPHNDIYYEKIEVK